MTVKQLIKKLEKYDLDMKVEVGSYESYPTIKVKKLKLISGPNAGKTVVTITAA